MPETAQPATANGQQPDDRLRLHDGETVVLEMLPSSWWTLGKYVFTFGLWAIWRKQHRYVLTNRRVLVLKGIISKTEQAVPLDRIQDAQLRRSPLAGGWITLSSAGGPLGVGRIGPLTQADALRFADELTSRIGHRTAGV